MIILKFIGLYFLLEILTGIGVCLEVAASIVITWLHTFKTDRILPLYSYYSVYTDVIKRVIIENQDKHNKKMAIPFVNMIDIIKTLKESYEKCLTSPEFIEHTHPISNVEREKISEIKSDNKLNIIKQVKILNDFIIEPIDIDHVLHKVNQGNYYMVGEKYTYDECCYVGYGIKMKPIFGKMNDNIYAIFDTPLETILEMFPRFAPINQSEITDEDITIIFTHRPDETDLCYLITSILYHRNFKKVETIDSEIVPEESNNEETVKLTK